MYLTQPKITVVNTLNLNHVQLADLGLDKYNGNEKCGDEMYQKHQNGHNFNFTNPNEVIQIVLESPWKCLTEEINLVSKFLVVLKWHTKWENIREHFGDFYKLIKNDF